MYNSKTDGNTFHLNEHMLHCAYLAKIVDIIISKNSRLHRQSRHIHVWWTNARQHSAQDYQSIQQ